jgi:hypothetical protein
MKTQAPIERLKPKEELSICPACGYTDGFHVSFKKSSRPAGWEIILICPQCHKKYSVTWHAQLETAG